MEKIEQLEDAPIMRNCNLPLMSSFATVEIREVFDVAFPKQLKKKMNGD